jgi:predicted dienelactone hydrolase
MRLLRSVAVALCAASAFAGSPDPPFRAGVATRAFRPEGPVNWRGARTHALITTIWYPVLRATRTAPQWIGAPDAPFASAGEAAPGAGMAPAPRRFPVVLLSHGTGGSALMMAWLGVALAERGYIAAAVNHPGNHALEPYTPQGFTLWWERATDLSLVLDGLLADPLFGPRIDAARAGVAGFSLGGFTAIEIAGGVGTHDRYEQFCRSPRADEMCREQVEFPDLREKLASLAADPEYQESVRGAGRSRRDPRVRAAFAIAPALGPAFRAEDLRRIAIPVAIVAGAADRVVPVESSARFFAAQIPRAQLKLYPGGVAHYTFLATCTASGRKAQPVLCGDASGVDRDAIHADAAAEAVRFFDRRLR